MFNVVSLAPKQTCSFKTYRDLDIDWTFMTMVDTMRRTTEKIKRDPWYKHKMAEPKKQFKFERKVYDDGVVVAKYRSCDQPNR